MAAKQIRPRDIFWLQNFLVERAWVAAGGPVSGTFFQEWWDLRQHFSASGSGFCHLEQKPPTYKCHLALSRQGSMTWDSQTAYLAGRLPGGPHVVVCLWHSPPAPRVCGVEEKAPFPAGWHSGQELSTGGIPATASGRSPFPAWYARATWPAELTPPDEVCPWSPRATLGRPGSRRGRERTGT